MNLPVSYILKHSSQNLIHKYFNLKLNSDYVPIEDLTPANRCLLEADAERVALMRDSWGQAALRETVSDTALSHVHPGPLDFALWALLYEPEEFVKAESLCARTPSRSGRLWYGFKFSGGGPMVNAPDMREQFARRLLRMLSLPDMPVLEFLPCNTQKFLSVRLGRKALLDLLYEPQKNQMHLVLNGPACHLEIAKNFVACFLPEADGASVQPCFYDLEPLFVHNDLPIDPEDGLQAARLTSVDLITTEGNSMSIVLRPDEPRGLPEVGRDLFGNSNLLAAGFAPNCVEISVSFYRNKAGSKRLPIRLHKAGASNIAGLCGAERGVAEKCLATWGVIAA